MTLRMHRRGLVGWVLGVAALGYLTMFFWTAVADTPELSRIMEDLPPALQAFVGDMDLTSPEGYLNAQLYAFMVPLLFLVYAIGRGADAIAGEEGRGTLDLLLAEPILRARVLWGKLVALLAGVVVLSVALAFVIGTGALVVGMGAPLRGVAAATVGVGFLALLFGVFALTLGAVTGSRASAIGATAAVAVAAYLIDAAATFVGWVEPFRGISPFYHAVGADPMRHGFQPAHLLALVLPTAMLVAIAVTAFGRRDVGV